MARCSQGHDGAYLASSNGSGIQLVCCSWLALCMGSTFKEVGTVKGEDFYLHANIIAVSEDRIHDFIIDTKH